MAQLQQVEIYTGAVERSYAPGVFELIEQAAASVYADDPEGAERILRRALALDPNDPMVMNNLARVVAQLGRVDKAVELTTRLHRRNPDYLFGRTALASLAVERGELDKARKLLEPLLKRQRLHVVEFAALCMAQMNLYLAAGDREMAEQCLNMWRQTVPEHPAIGLFERRLRQMKQTL